VTTPQALMHGFKSSVRLWRPLAENGILSCRAFFVNPVDPSWLQQE